MPDMQDVGKIGSSAYADASVARVEGAQPPQSWSVVSDTRRGGLVVLCASRRSLGGYTGGGWRSVAVSVDLVPTPRQKSVVLRTIGRSREGSKSLPWTPLSPPAELINKLCIEGSQ